MCSVEGKSNQRHAMTDQAKEKGSRKPLQRRSIARVESILATALNLFGQDGISEVSVKDIAAHAGITPSSIYQYFPDKRAIVRALGGRLRKHIANITDSYKGEINNSHEVGEYSEHLLRRFLDLFSTEPGWLLIINEIRTSNDFIDRSYSYSLDLNKRFADNLAHLVSDKHRETLFELCFWWGHMAYATVLFGLQRHSQVDYSIKLARDSLIDRVEELVRLNS